MSMRKAPQIYVYFIYNITMLPLYLKGFPQEQQNCHGLNHYGF